MTFEDKIGRRIYNDFGGEKIAVGIQDKNLNIKFFKSYLWGFPLCVMLGFLLNLKMLEVILKDLQYMLAIVIFIIATIITIITVLSSRCKIYYEGENLILENGLRKKKYISIKEYPRLYIRQHIYTTNNTTKDTFSERECYNLYIEQNEQLIKLDIRVCGYEKIEKLINSLEFKEKSECTKQEWNSSVNEREKKMFAYKEFLDGQKRIVGVVDTEKNMKIDKNKNIGLYFLNLLLIFCIFIIIICMIEKIYEVVIAISLINILIIGGIITKIMKRKIKISYKEDEINIDKYKLNYRENNIRLSINMIQFPIVKEKYEYSLVIIGEKDKYAIPLEKAKISEIGEFIDNIIFEEI